MANLLAFGGNLAKLVNRDVIQPAYHGAVLPTANTLGAAGAGLGGLSRVGAAAITHNPLAEQNAINQTNTAVDARLAKTYLSPQAAHQGGFQLVVPTLKTAGAIAPYVAGGAGGIGLKAGLKAAGAFGTLNAGSTALQGDFKPKDLAKSFALGAAPVGVGAAAHGAFRAAIPKAPTRLNPTEVGRLNTYHQQMGRGLPMSDSVYRNGVAAAKKAGINHADSQAVGNVIKAHLNYQTQLKKGIPALNQKFGVGKLGLSTKDVSKMSNAELSGIGPFRGQQPPDFLKTSPNYKPKSPAEITAGTEAALKAVKRLPNPETPGPLDGTVGNFPVVKNAAQAHLNADFVAKHLQDIGGKAEKAVTSLSAKDQALMKQIQTKGVEEVAAKADSPAAFREAEKSLRAYYDTRIAYDHANGIKTPYRQNYLRDLIPDAPKSKIPVQGGNFQPGYTLPKENPGNTGVLEGLQRDIKGASFNHAKLTYAKGLEQTFPDQISRGQPNLGEHGLEQQLHTPYGEELFASKDIAKQINKRAVALPAEGALGKYDQVNALAKYIKLGGGGFHAITEGGNFIGQQLASGKLFKDPAASAKLFKTIFSSKSFSRETSRMAQNGTLDKARLGGLTWLPGDIKADVNITPKGVLSKYTGITAIHDATFKREIPYAKLKTFEQKTQGIDTTTAEGVAKLRSVAKAVNAEFGGINRFVEGIGPQNAKRWSRILLASDFTESKITTMKNAIAKGGEEGKLAREVVAGKALLFGSLAVGGAALGGELKNKNSNDKIATIASKILDPSFNFGSYKVSLPATHVSEFTKPFKSFGNGSNDKFSGLKHYATGRLAAVPSELNQLVNNQDYRGQNIYGTKTKPISGGKTALNVASGVIPIPGSQGISAATGQQSIPSAIANIVGLRSYQPTPSKAQQAAQKVQQTGNYDLKTIKANPPKGYSLQQTADGRYAYTLDDGQVQTSRDLKTARQKIAEDAFSKSGDSYKVLGQTVYRKDSAGNVSKMTKDNFDYKVGAVTLTAQKNSGDLRGWLSTANDQLSLINKQLQSPNIDPLDSATLKNDAAAIQSQIDKYSGYGGFTKPKKAKTTSFKTAAAIKTPKLPGIKVAKARAFKAPSQKKLAISKIPVHFKGKSVA